MRRRGGAPGSTIVTGEKSAAKSTITLDEIDEQGWWGLYTVAFKPGKLGETNGNRCLDPGDLEVDDKADCWVELMPTSPDVIVGVDRTDPTVDAALGVTTLAAGPCRARSHREGPVGDRRDYRRRRDRPGDVGYPPDRVQQRQGRLGRLSRRRDALAALTRRRHQGGFCARRRPGRQHRAHDTDHRPRPRVPDVDRAADSLPAPGRNGWYEKAPSFTIGNFSDPGGLNRNPRYEWWIDDNVPTGCSGVTCSVPAGEVGLGHHELHWQAIDYGGNRQAVQTLPFRVDGDAPTARLDVLAPEPQGDNGWYRQRPLVVVSGADGRGGSGLTADSVRLSLNGDAQVADGPVELGPGEWSVCWWVVGCGLNATATDCLPDKVKVDDASPTVDVVPVPAAPDGQGSWYVNDVAVQVAATDATPGSGFTLELLEGIDALCAGNLEQLAQFAHRPNGTCVSVDGMAYRPYSGPVALGEGIHVIRAFAVDGSGRQSDVVVRVVDIDRSAPVPTIRALPAEPSRDGWWRRVRHVAVRAVDGDRNSGLLGFASLQYRLDGGEWKPVLRPIALEPGITTLDVRAIDAAGLERIETLEVPLDPDAPIAKATGATNQIFSPVMKLLAPLNLKPLPTDTNLRWEVTDPTATSVHVSVIVFSVTGEPVRHLDGGTHVVQPGVTTSGAVKWDGKDHSVTRKVPLGVYFYRVVVTDAAGNSGMSGHSKPITLKLG